jgi:peptidoglycan hydrolase-like protein with peptidoglycan-binding domain
MTCQDRLTSCGLLLAMAACDIQRIDDLLAGTGGVPIRAGDPDRQAVGVVQGLLVCHGFTRLPGLLSSVYGAFGPETSAALSQFQQAQKIPATGNIDTATLQALVTAPATNPLACAGYLSFVLDFAASQLLRIVSLTTQFEGGGRFCALNRNTDRAGLSFGLIQWAQRPGRLHELLAGFQRIEPDRFVTVVADGDADLADRLLRHTGGPNGGVTAQGVTTDPAFDLIAEPWATRFQHAGLDKPLQRAQVGMALADFTASLERLQRDAPQITTERGVAFMLDLANQHGDGGAQSIVDAVVRQNPSPTEPELLQAIQAESVARVARLFGADNVNTRATLNRREAFRTTTLLSDAPFAVGA